MNMNSFSFQTVDVKENDGDASTIKNCVVISDNLILVALIYSYSVFDKDLKEISTTVMTSIHPDCTMIYCLAESFLKHDLVLVLDARPEECKNEYEVGNKPGRNSLVIKAEIDPESSKLNINKSSSSKNSIVLTAAYTNSITEVANNKLLVALKPTDLLYIVDFTVKQIIRDPNTSNDMKF